MNNCWKVLIANAKNARNHVLHDTDLWVSLGAAIAECEADLKLQRAEPCDFCAAERLQPLCAAAIAQSKK
jgi:hypothetical protein